MISGRATAEGTSRFAARFSAKTHKDFYRKVEDLTLSSLGLGTYLGDVNNTDDEKLEKAIVGLVSSGVNVIDTAINYRAQRSERVIGRTLAKLISEKVISRDEIFISTKGGFIPFDGEQPADGGSYFRDHFLKTKILNYGDVVAGCHSLAPNYIDNQFETSRRNLGLEIIDLYYLHNPEIQLEEISHDDFLKRLHRAFMVLEKKVTDKKLSVYGTATWNGYRVGAPSSELLNLEEIAEVAGNHGEAHGFKFIQLPFNLTLPEALTTTNQNGVTILEKARTLGIHVMASSSLMQAEILGKLTKNMDILAPAGMPDAVKALNYVRSTPGIQVALCGMKEESHLIENLRLAEIPVVSKEVALSLTKHT